MRIGGRAVRAVLKISAGTAVAQLIIAVASPIISRIFSPSEVGVYTVIASAAAIVGAVASLRWDFAVTLPEREGDAHSVTALGLASVFAVSILAFGTAWVVGVWVDGARHLMPWLLLMPVAAAGQAAMKVLNQLAIRHRRYSAIATRALMRSSAVVLAQIGLGLAGLKAGGLVIGLAIGNAVGILGLLRGSGVTSSEARVGRTRSKLRENAARYRRFPLFLAPSSLINVVGTQLPVMLVAAFYGQEVVGWFGLTQTAIALPAALIGQAVAQVYLGEISESLRTAALNQRHLFRRASLSLLAAAALLLVLLLIAAPALFPVVFGERWATSGLYAAALAPGLAMQILAVPTSQTISLMGRQNLQLTWDVFRLILTSGSFVAVAAFGVGATVAITVLGISQGIAYLVLWLLARSVTLSGGSATADKETGPESAA